jgi:hypothetical protein
MAIVPFVGLARGQQPGTLRYGDRQDPALHTPDSELVSLERTVEALRGQLAALQKPNQQAELSKQQELLFQKVEEQKKMIEQLEEYLKTPAVSKTATQMRQTQTPVSDPLLKQSSWHAQDQVPPRRPADSSRVASLRHTIEDLQGQVSAAQKADQQDEKQKKQIELLQKQMVDQQKMIELLLEQMKKQPLAGTPVEKLQTQTATLEARSRQAAQRDQDLAQGVDNISEHLEAEERNGPRFPTTLKELFLPSQTNESPLTIHGVITGTYTKFQGQPGDFALDEFSPFFLLKLNDQFLIECELGFSESGVELSQAQIDFIANDWLTVVAGRYLVPIGFFNERLHPSWINKLPDFPLMFRQVSPADFKTNGVQLRGAFALGSTPVKLEYSVFAGNGLGLNEQQPDLSQIVNLQGYDTFHELNHNIAFGGRLGFWIPECGLMGGISGMCNGAYTPSAGDSFDLWLIDLGYRKGNWDVRFEYAQMFQEAVSFIGNNINRRGLWAQVAYRPYYACEIVRDFEGVFRLGYTNFSGIDPNALDLTTFDTPVDVPVNRTQYAVGINYYFYPSLVLKCAYEINKEHGDINLKDNVFMAQVAWGF